MSLDTGVHERPRVLLVDDEPSILELLRLWFEPLDWEVVTASSGPGALARAVQWRPHAIVIDSLLPGYSGLEMVRRLRRVDLRAVVIMCTACDGAQDRSAGLSVGADDYLVKPYSLAELEGRLKELLAQRADHPTWHGVGSSPTSTQNQSDF